MIHKNNALKFLIIGMLLNILGADLQGTIKKTNWHEDDTLMVIPGDSIIYKTIDTVNLAMDIMHPPDIKAGESYPAIIFFFGGGWNGGSIQQFEPHAIHFAKRGMIAIRADYRVKKRQGTTPFDAVEDAKSAIRYLRENADMLQIDTSRIVASGGSAGGHLAAAAATLKGLDNPTENRNISSKPNALVLFNPVFDNGPDGYGYDRIGDRFPEISPIHNIRKGAPPTIVFLGTEDRLIPVETAEVYKKKMEVVGSRCDLFIYEGQKHGFFNFKNTENYQKTLREADNFLVSLGYIEAQSTILTGTNSQEKPNVLFIAVDDLNDWVGCLGGHPQAITPNIDKLASKGMLFTNAHCQAPICGPSRASVMTGLYPSTSGNYLQVKDKDIKKAGEAAERSIFLPDYFETYGYKTLGVGKIYHSGDEANTFDEYGGIFAKYGPRPEERMNYDPAWFGYPNGTSTDWGAYPEHDSLMPDHKSANWAVEQLNSSHEKPFFLAVGFIRPHVPWFVPQKWFDIYSSMEMVRPPYNPDDYNDIPDMGRRVTESPQMPTTEYLLEKGQWEDVIRAYLACVTFVDAQIGKVLDALEGSDYAENTIVVLWGDHGYHLGEKNRFAKQALWERDTRVPLVIRQPGAKAGESCNAPVGLIDLYPTLADLAGLPANPMNEGNSLQPLLEDPVSEWKKTALSFYGTGNVSVRDKRYRLIQYEDGSQELYDLKKDPNEWTNLALQRKYSGEINRLLRSVPEEWATSSPYSTYNWNEYFRNKTD